MEEGSERVGDSLLAQDVASMAQRRRYSARAAASYCIILWWMDRGRNEGRDRGGDEQRGPRSIPDSPGSWFPNLPVTTWNTNWTSLEGPDVDHIVAGLYLAWFNQVPRPTSPLKPFLPLACFLLGVRNGWPFLL